MVDTAAENLVARFVFRVSFVVTQYHPYQDQYTPMTLEGGICIVTNTSKLGDIIKCKQGFPMNTRARLYTIGQPCDTVAHI